MPDYVVTRLRDEFGVEPVRADVTRLGDLASASDAVYLTPQKPHQLSLFTGEAGVPPQLHKVDALYVTRPQTERYSKEEMARTGFVHLDKQRLAADPLRNAVVMHPLPRRDEISSDIDEDPRSVYFKQAGRGVPMRMAILAFLLGRIDMGTASAPAEVRSYPVTVGTNPCPNPTCISRTEMRHVLPRYRLASRLPVRASCGYCDAAFAAPLVGCTTTLNFHESGSSWVRRIRPDHLVFFVSAGQAQALGFRPAGQATELV